MSSRLDADCFLLELLCLVLSIAMSLSSFTQNTFFLAPVPLCYNPEFAQHTKRRFCNPIFIFLSSPFPLFRLTESALSKAREDIFVVLLDSLAFDVTLLRTAKNRRHTHTSLFWLIACSNLKKTMEVAFARGGISSTKVFFFLLLNFALSWCVSTMITLEVSLLTT